jgi:ABC-2 type transport system ATP-binding protein
MSGADPIAVQAERITHRFAKRIALDDVSFAVPRGRMLALLGPNGSGKSTLFRILATILRPTSGSASICGAPVTARPEAVRRRLGVVFQRPALDPLLTVMENLRAHGHLYGLAGKDLAARAEAALALMDLAGRRRDRVIASPPSRAACSGASSWPRRCCTAQRSCCWTSPAPAWIRRRAAT